MKILGFNLPLLPRPASPPLRDARPVVLRRQSVEAGDRYDSAAQRDASPLLRRGQAVESWPYARLRDAFADARPPADAWTGHVAFVGQGEPAPGAAAFAYQWPLAATTAEAALRVGDGWRTLDTAAFVAALDPGHVPNGNRTIYFDGQPRWTLSTRLYP